MTKPHDEAYWAEYYRSGAAPEVPSEFARYVMDEYIQKIGGITSRMVELGCGNGRDARYFAANGIEVDAFDQCVTDEQQATSISGNPNYIRGDFTALEDRDMPADLVYSRFTLHSVDAAGQNSAITWAHRNLVPGGHLLIETRGQKNELYGLGDPVDGEPDAFVYEDHYRRFVDFYDFVDEIERAGFSVKEASEETGYAPFKDTDFHFIRVVGKK